MNSDLINKRIHNTFTSCYEELENEKELDKNINMLKSISQYVMISICANQYVKVCKTKNCIFYLFFTGINCVFLSGNYTMKIGGDKMLKYRFNTKMVYNIIYDVNMLLHWH